MPVAVLLTLVIPLGAGGNDLIDGGLGNDSLGGSTGLDTFLFSTALNAATNVDTILDFNITDDTVRLENAILAAIQGVGALNSAQFVANTAGVAETSDQRIVYESDTGKLCSRGSYKYSASYWGRCICFKTASVALPGRLSLASGILQPLLQNLSHQPHAACRN
ncbi:hypothetical protein KXS15_29580 [Sinorhizobium meliloti]